MEIKEEDVYKVLQDVIDPEIGISIVDLELVRKVTVSESGVHILMTLTSPMCPFADIIISDINDGCILAGIGEPEIELTFEPIWEPSKRLKLRLGI
jgi:metal-sulfur cluster biosynthetic enzyme